MTPAIRTFERYHDAMAPVAQRLARVRARAHPYLQQDDLMQEGLLVLWQVWARLGARKSFEALCRIGTVAMARRMADQYARVAGSQLRPEASIRVVPLQTPLTPDGAVTVGETLLGGDADNEVRMRLELWETEQTLSQADRQVFGELLTPALSTLAITRRLLARRPRRPWRRVRAEAVAKSLQVPVSAVQRAEQRIQRRIEAVLDGSWTFTRYRRGTGALPHTSIKEAVSMSQPGGVGAVVDPDELPGDETPAADNKSSEAKPAKKKKAPAAPKAKAADKKPAKTPAKTPAKAADKKPAAKKADKPKPAKAQEKPAGPKLAVGTKVKYLGGSKADWLKKGAVGEIKSIYGKDTVRYGVKFAERATVIAAKYIEKA